MPPRAGASAEWNEALSLLAKPPGHEVPQNCNPSNCAGVRMGEQEIASAKADLRKDADQTLNAACNKVVQDADPGIGLYRLHLAHHTGAAELAPGVLFQGGRVVQSRRIGEILDAGDHRMLLQFLHRAGCPMSAKIAPRGVDAERIVDQTRYEQASLSGLVQHDRQIGLAPRQRECPRQRD